MNKKQQQIQPTLFSKQGLLKRGVFDFVSNS